MWNGGSVFEQQPNSKAALHFQTHQIEKRTHFPRTAVTCWLVPNAVLVESTLLFIFIFFVLSLSLSLPLVLLLLLPPFFSVFGPSVISLCFDSLSSRFFGGKQISKTASPWLHETTEKNKAYCCVWGPSVDSVMDRGLFSSFEIYFVLTSTTTSSNDEGGTAWLHSPSAHTYNLH